MDYELRQKAIAASKGDDLEILKESLQALGMYKKINSVGKVFNKFKKIASSIFEDSSTKRGTQDFLQLLITHAVDNNNLEFCKFLVDSNELRTKVEIDNKYIWERIVKLENQELLHYLVNNIKDKKKNAAQEIISALEYSISHVNLNTFKYLLTDTTMPHHKEVLRFLKERHFFDETPLTNFEIFVKACGANKKELVEILVGHEDYRLMISKNSFLRGLETSCTYNHLELLIFLLNNEKVPFVPYKDYDPIKLLEMTCGSGDEKIAKYLILDFKVKEPSDFDEFSRNSRRHSPFFDLGAMFARKRHPKNVLAIKELFEKRRVYDDLQNNLEVKTEYQRPKIKI